MKFTEDRGTHIREDLPHKFRMNERENCAHDHDFLAHFLSSRPDEFSTLDLSHGLPHRPSTIDARLRTRVPHSGCQKITTNEESPLLPADADLPRPFVVCYYQYDGFSTSCNRLSLRARSSSSELKLMGIYLSLRMTAVYCSPQGRKGRVSI